MGRREALCRSDNTDNQKKCTGRDYHCRNANLVSGCGCCSGVPDYRADQPHVCSSFLCGDTQRRPSGKGREEALDAGLPIFASEFGLCEASGDGSIDYAQSDEWFALFREHNISYAAWNISNKAETSALFSSACTKTSGYTDEDLSESGKYKKKKFRVPIDKKNEIYTIKKKILKRQERHDT